jgi:hypothetical protein
MREEVGKGDAPIATVESATTAARPPPIYVRTRSACDSDRDDDTYGAVEEDRERFVDDLRAHTGE